MTPERANRVADFIRSELADIVQNQMRDPRVSLLSITDTRVSRDLGVADVYVTSLNAREARQRTELLAVLNGAAGFLRSALAGRHTMRTTPRLRFHYDELIEGGPRLEALIDRAVQADGEGDVDPGSPHATGSGIGT
ncbi:MAG: 30S ribosome-binding factor RbfA [Gammaproteobacteria bacterium]|nr:30S ribosome-binding factor RbfA [Gammaproteobacteria bacterium]